MCKDNKNYDFNKFFSSVSVFDVRSEQYHDACKCIPLFANKLQHCVSWYSCKHAVKIDTEEKKSLNKVIFVFFMHKMYSHSFITLQLNH